MQREMVSHPVFHVTVSKISQSHTHGFLLDVPAILDMIKEHAEYEGSPSACLATEESLMSTLNFDPATEPLKQGYARTLLVRVPASPESSSFNGGWSSSSESIAGMALYIYNYSTWRGKPGIFLDDLFVRPQYRKKGYGKMLLQRLAEEVLKIDGCRLEWNCSVMNESSLAWYRSFGAREMREWIPLRLEWDALENLARGQTKRANGTNGESVKTNGTNGESVKTKGTNGESVKTNGVNGHAHV